METTRELNLVKVLNGAPEGLMLYSPVLGDARFERIDGQLDSIIVKFKDSYTKEFTYTHTFDRHGRAVSFAIDGECMLFPSRENRDWSTFKLNQ